MRDCFCIKALYIRRWQNSTKKSLSEFPPRFRGRLEVVLDYEDCENIKGRDFNNIKKINNQKMEDIMKALVEKVEFALFLAFPLIVTAITIWSVFR